MQTLRFLTGLAAPLALALPGFAAAPVQVDFDFSVTAVKVIQALPGVTLGGGKSTCVRINVDVAGPIGTSPAIDALLRVYVGGIEESYSPVYSQNGPLSPPREGFTLANINDSINFYLIPPTGPNVEFIVELNPPGPGQVVESDYSNNMGTAGILDFQCKRAPEVVYVPIDYRPSGGGENLPNLALIKPGVGDNFIQAIYPSGDWDYHRSDVPSKLWTNSLNGSGSALLNSLAADLNMMSPRPDFIYGWVRGGLPYNGQANGIPGVAGMGNTQSFKHQRTFAHELGHLLGRVHVSTRTVKTGFDVEHQLNQTQGLPIVKRISLNDIMVPGLNTNQAWIASGDFNFMSNSSTFRCGTARGDGAGGMALMIGGLWDRDANTIELTDSVAFSGGVASPTVPLEQANLILRAWSAGAVSQEFGLLVNTTTDTCADLDADGNTSDSWEGQVNLAGFTTVLPDTLDVTTLERLEVVEAASGLVLATLQQSAAAPVVELLEPREGSRLGGQLVLAWDATDADGDALSAYVRYSPDGTRMVPLASNVTEGMLAVDFDALPALQAGGFFEILTTDGLRTTRVQTTGLTTSQSRATNQPFGHILTPDTGKVYQRGATVILHGAGWDIEDRSLEGASLVWTSSIDGVIGTGRLDQPADLSLGTHVLTLTVTDSDSNTTTDTVVITITDRVLPMEICQPDIGFGGPGTSVLQVCGGDLSTGTNSQIELIGAAPLALMALIYSDMNNPIPALGGTLVPLPILGMQSGVTDATGYWTFPGGINGGGGPMTLYGQVVYLDPMLGFGISNAVQLNFLP